MSMLGRHSDAGVVGTDKPDKVPPKLSVGTHSNKLFYLGGKRSELGKYPELAIRMTG